MELIDEGAFGQVFETKTAGIVEKRIKIDQDEYMRYGLPFAIIRELSILKALEKRPFIVPLLSVEFNLPEHYVSLFFTKYKNNLRNQPMTKTNVGKIMYQILLGLKQAETLQILHRDLKPQNIFMNSEDDVVVGDWGLACLKQNKLSNNVQTLHYRAPEILLGSTNYDNRIDLWSLACLFYELQNNFEILFEENEDQEQLFRIFELLGSPTEIDSLHTLPNFKKEWPIYCRHMFNLNLLKTQFLCEEAWDLFLHMLELDPSKRFTLDKCLQHSFFDSIRSSFLIEEFPKLEFQSQNTKLLQKHVDINIRMRMILFDWIYPIVIKYKWDLGIFFLTIQYIDLYLEKHLDLHRNNLQLIGIVCLMLSVKYQTNKLLQVTDYCYLCDDAYTCQQLLDTEIKVLKTLEYQLTQFSSYMYLKENTKNHDVFKKSCCVLFLLTSHAENIHPQNILEYFTSDCKLMCETIQKVIYANHPKAIIEKVNHLYNENSKSNIFLSLSKSDQLPVPDFLQPQS